MREQQQDKSQYVEATAAYKPPMSLLEAVGNLAIEDPESYGVVHDEIFRIAEDSRQLYANLSNANAENRMLKQLLANANFDINKLAVEISVLSGKTYFV